MRQRALIQTGIFLATIIYTLFSECLPRTALCVTDAFA
jgi:hypothetical protein